MPDHFKYYNYSLCTCVISCLFISFFDHQTVVISDMDYVKAISLNTAQPIKHLVMFSIF